MLGKDSLVIIPKAQAIEEEIEKLDFIKIKNIHFSKDTSRQFTEWETKSANHISDKVQKYTKNAYNSVIRR